MSERVALPDRFWSKVERTDGCWLWTASRYPDGYGLFWFDGKPRRTHRLAYESANGAIPEGLFVLHLCDTPLCVRPDHLRLGSQRDNMRDMRAKGRHARAGASGERNGHAKLTTSNVLDIRRRRAAGERAIDLAASYGVHRDTIRRITRRKYWSKVE